MSEHRGAGSSGGRRVTRKQLLDGLRDVAALEHAHCVYYLRLHYSLGGDPPEGGDPRPAPVQDAAQVASQLAQSDMFHLKDVNRILVRAGRDPALDRAARATSATGRAIDLQPMTAAQFRDFPKREKALAAAVDSAYARLRSALSTPTPPLTGELLDELRFVLDMVAVEGSDHTSKVLGLAQTLAGLTPAEYLLVTGVAPADELDRRLLALSDEFYGSLLAILGQQFADVGGLGPPLREQAVSRMEDMHKVNGMLGLRGLLPPFTTFN